ncbi:MAG: STAS domain-containing protein [Candidatus Gracilibacteria bacterium]|nr:STAS domain-containing protein [Candidatus Gracilibacteria bacterium]MDD2908401.1 STAS domain-containing protein [Candidatus Gracilibacteria bacterium]
MENKKNIPLDIKTNNGESIIICTIKGETDNINIDSVFNKIAEDIKDYNKVILNLSELIFCNSKFLGNLFFLADTIEKKGGKLCILGCNPLVYDSLSIVGIFDVIPYFEDKESSLDYLK